MIFAQRLKERAVFATTIASPASLAPTGPPISAAGPSRARDRRTVEFIDCAVPGAPRMSHVQNSAHKPIFRCGRMKNFCAIFGTKMTGIRQVGRICLAEEKLVVGGGQGELIPIPFITVEKKP